MSNQQATLVLRRARVLTMDPHQPRADFVAVAGSRILAVGRDGDEDVFVGPGTRLCDCEGGTLLPGFIDAHTHVLASATTLLSADCRPPGVTSIAQLQDVLRRQAEVTPAEGWVRGFGYDEFHLRERRHPTRAELDAAVSDRPLRLNHRSGHAAALNSLGLARVGIGRDAPDPPGSVVERDGSGEPTGVLYDADEYLDTVIPRLSGEELRSAVARLGREYLALGVTSLQDATASNRPEQWELLRWLRAQGVLPQRVTMMVDSRALGEFVKAGLGPGAGDDGLRLGPAKLVLSEASGAMVPEPPQVEQLTLAAHRTGYQVALHAVEVPQLALALSVLEEAQRRVPRPQARHRIEHASVVPPGYLGQLSRLGVVVVTQPVFIHHSGERYLEQVPPEERPFLYRMRSLLAEGVCVAAGSDSPVGSRDPLLGMVAAVTRRAASSDVLGEGEGVSPYDALRFYTAAAAYAAGEEKAKGVIAPGMLADLVLLDGDVLETPPLRLTELRVRLVLLDGAVAYEGSQTADE